MISIPKHSKKVFQGILHEVHQWEQELYDGSYRTFEVVQRRSSVDAVATVGDQVMVLLQQQPGRTQYPALPGGWMEENEEPLSAIKRELCEETGYASDDIIMVEEYLGTSKYQFHQYEFVARNCRKVTEQQLDGGEIIEVQLVSYPEFLQFCRQPDFAVSIGMRMRMYEALLDDEKREEFRQLIFGK